MYKHRLIRIRTVLLDRTNLVFIGENLGLGAALTLMVGSATGWFDHETSSNIPLGLPLPSPHQRQHQRHHRLLYNQVKVNNSIFFFCFSAVFFSWCLKNIFGGFKIKSSEMNWQQPMKRSITLNYTFTFVKLWDAPYSCI